MYNTILQAFQIVSTKEEWKLYVTNAPKVYHISAVIHIVPKDPRNIVPCKTFTYPHFLLGLIIRNNLQCNLQMINSRSIYNKKYIKDQLLKVQENFTMVDGEIGNLNDSVRFFFEICV